MKSIYLIAAAAMTLASCKNYLDIKPNGQTIPKTADEFSALLNNTLNSIDKGEEYVVGNIASVAMFECYADNLETSLTDYSTGVDLPLYIGDNLSDMQSSYRLLYENIRNSNIIIGELKERDTRLGRDVLGTAYALRGVCYYQLMRQFCPPFDPAQKELLGVPLVTEFNMEAQPLRSSLESTVEQIISDFQQALEYDIQDNNYRFNNDVIRGYLARTCFWSQRYAEAIAYADPVLEKHPLLNGTPYQEMMTSQVIRKGNTLLKANILSSSEDNTEADGYKIFLKSRPLSSRFLNLFVEKSKDIRYGLLLGSTRQSKKNIYASLRSAELCLILAESYYHQGSTDNALKYLNQLRRNRIEGVVDFTLESLPPVNTKDIIKVDAMGQSLTPLLSAILNERRKEFYLENGDRWFELKRNGCPELWVAKGGSKYTTQKFMYTFPLYIRDILLVKGLIQNPGYENIQ